MSYPYNVLVHNQFAANSNKPLYLAGEFGDFDRSSMFLLIDLLQKSVLVEFEVVDRRD